MIIYKPYRLHISDIKITQTKSVDAIFNKVYHAIAYSGVRSHCLSTSLVARYKISNRAILFI